MNIKFICFYLTKLSDLKLLILDILIVGESFLNGEGMRIFKVGVLLVFLMVVLVYVVSITTLPGRVVLFKGDDLRIDTVFGLSVSDFLDGDALEVSREFGGCRRGAN